MMTYQRAVGEHQLHVGHKLGRCLVLHHVQLVLDGFEIHWMLDDVKVVLALMTT